MVLPRQHPVARRFTSSPLVGQCLLGAHPLHRAINTLQETSQHLPGTDLDKARHPCAIIQRTGVRHEGNGWLRERRRVEDACDFVLLKTSPPQQTTLLGPLSLCGVCRRVSLTELCTDKPI